MLFAAFGIAGFYVIYLTLSTNLQKRMDEDLLNEVAEFSEIYRLHGPQILESLLINEAQSEGITRMYCRLMTPERKVLASSDMREWGDVITDPAVIAESREGSPVLMTRQVPSLKYSARIVVARMYDGKILELGESMEDDEDLKAHYREMSQAAVAVMLIAGAMVGWFVSRKAMLGVERVTNTAISIGRGDLDHRVPLGREGAEIQALAIAFNEMINRISVLITELKDVTNSIAHDLKSPITRIRVMAETALTENESKDEYREMAGMVIEECDNLVGMIDTLLDLAEAEAGVMKLPGDLFDLAESVKSVCELYDIVAQQNGITCTVDVSPEPVSVKGDKKRIQGVIANILDNAMKYTPADGKIAVRVRALFGYAIVTVTDSGIGISESDLPRIFEPFYRADRSRSTRGYGLGLSLVQSVIRAHGGKVEVRSTPSVGTIFTIILPYSS